MKVTQTVSGQDGTQIHLDLALPHDTCFPPTFDHVTCKVIECDLEKEVPKEAGKNEGLNLDKQHFYHRKHKPMTCYIWSSSSFSPKG